MTKNPHISDLQLILLSHAAQREDGSLLPVPEKFTGEAARIGKAIPPLLKRQLVEEAPVTDRSRAWRDDDQQPIGIFITAAGRALIAADENGKSDGEQIAEPDAPVLEVAAAAPRTGSKTDLVIGLLRSPDGATIAELTGATGWLPHTTRAALTGLRKKGHAVERTKRGDVSCYRIAAAA
jgi:hypothetical protein